MQNTIDTSVSFFQLQVDAEKAVKKVGKQALGVTKTLGLWRAALVLKNPDYNEDPAKAMSLSYNIVVKALASAGMDKKTARSAVNNAKSAADLAGAVILRGMSETVYRAVPIGKCTEVAEHIATLDDLSEINDLKVGGGRLSKTAKAALGIKDTPKAEAPKVEDEDGIKDTPKGIEDTTEVITEDLSDTKAVMRCLSLLTEVKQIADKHLCESSKLEVRQSVLALLHEFNRAKDESETVAA